MAIQILLVHANTDNRTRLVETLQGTSDISIIATVCSGQEALDCITTTLPDVMLMELNLPDIGCLQASHHIRATHPQIKLLIQSKSFNEDSFSAILKSGAQGCLTPDCTTEELTNAIQTVFQGKPYFCAESQELLIQTCLSRSRS